MEVIYNGILVKDGEFLQVYETQIEPKIKLNFEPNKYYTLIMYDPDAVKGTYIHWTKVNITNNDIKTGNIIIPYKSPASPTGSGKHRYIFELYEQNRENKVTEIVNRIFSINKMRNKVNVNIPIYKIHFISENKVGGIIIKIRIPTKTRILRKTRILTKTRILRKTRKMKRKC